MKRYRRAAGKAVRTLALLIGGTGAIVATVLTATWLVDAGYGWWIVAGFVVFIWLWGAWIAFFDELGRCA